MNHTTCITRTFATSAILTVGMCVLASFPLAGLFRNEQTDSQSGAWCASAWGYELPEVDGDDVAGNAPAILGWPEWELPLTWAVVENNSPGSPVTTPAFQASVEASFAVWQDVPTSTIEFEKANDNGADNGIIILNEPVTSHCFSPLRNYNSGRQGPPFDDGIHNVVFCVRSGWDVDYGLSSTALAVTLFSYDTDSRRISGGDLFLNCDNMYGLWDVIDPSNPNTGAYDLQNTITHEIGHFIGLAHPYTSGRETSTMFYSTCTGETSKRVLSDDDVNGVNYLYPEPGVLLIPPDSNVAGLKDLSNPPSGGGCSVSKKSQPGLQLALSWLLPYILFIAIVWKRRQRLV